MNNFSSSFIRRFYERPSRSTIGKQLKIHYLIRTVLELFKNYDYEKMFQMIKTSKIENLISIYGDMDFPKGLLTKLIKNPLFLSFFIKFILKKPNIIVRFLKILTK